VLQLARGEPFLPALRVALEMGLHDLVAVFRHRPEFQADEAVPVPADAPMAVENPAAIRKFHQRGEHHEKRTEQRKRQKSAREIEPAFAEPSYWRMLAAPS
jgi:hypothetical protein